jgi:type VI protein secretion system component VasF
MYALVVNGSVQVESTEQNMIGLFLTWWFFACPAEIYLVSQFSFWDTKLTIWRNEIYL